MSMDSPDAESGLQLYLLGGFRAVVDGLELPPPKRIQTLRTWAYLLLHPEHALDRAMVAEVLWPEEEPSRARFNLRHALHAIGKGLPPSGSNQPWILADRRSVRWNPEVPTRVDVHDLHEARVMANDARGVQGAVAQLEAAANNYGGPLLLALDDGWLQPLRERAAQDFAVVLEQLAVVHEAQGTLHSAVEAIRRLLLHDPLRESAHRTLIRLHALRGDRASALRQYDACVRLLREDLGVVPESATIELAECIRTGASAPARAAQAAGDWIPPPEAKGPYVDDVGRVSEVMALLGGPSLLTLIGPAGVGKSRLAAEIARQCAEEGVARAAWCALQDAASEDLEAAVCAALGGGDDTHPSLARCLAGLDDEAVLLVLDGADALLDPLVQIIEGIRKAGTSMTLIVTSREALRVSDERRYPVPRLTLPGVSIRLGVSESERLLRSVITDIRPGHVPTPAEKPTAAELCAALDGLPLAIVVLAHRLADKGMMSVLEAYEAEPQAIVLEGAVPSGDGCGRSVPSMSKAIEVGWARLSIPERVLLRRMAIFQRPADLVELEAVCADVDRDGAPPIPREARSGSDRDRVLPSDVLDLVARLADRSWIEVVAGSPYRYELLLTTRCWLRRRLEASGERPRLESLLLEAGRPGKRV